MMSTTPSVFEKLSLYIKSSIFLVKKTFINAKQWAIIPSKNCVTSTLILDFYERP